jgi:YD repeat-containing protein
VTSYADDEVRNLTGRTDVNNHTTAYGYDPARRLTSVTSPIGQAWTYGYDGAGNLTSVVTARGNATPAHHLPMFDFEPHAPPGGIASGY